MNLDDSSPVKRAADEEVAKASQSRDQRQRQGEPRDRGSQYASDDFRSVLDQYDVMASMSRKGNCWDNAVTETLFGSLKVEQLHGERFETIRQAKDAVLAWLLVQPATHALNSELSQPRGVRKPLGG